MKLIKKGRLFGILNIFDLFVVLVIISLIAGVYFVFIRDDSGIEKEKVLDHYLAKHPELKDFVLSPSCALLKITVNTYYVVNRFQNVLELHMT